MRMRQRCAGWAATAGFLAAIGLGSSARAQETEIAIKDVPRAVMDSAKAKFPGATMREAAKETEEGKTLFEVSLTHDGHKMDVTFQEDGTLVLVETEVSEREVPAVVAKAVKGKYPGAKCNLVESVKKGPKVKKEVDYYEFHLTTADKKSVEVEVDAKGKIMNTEENKEEEEKEKE
jgi:hypothetical protein